MRLDAAIRALALAVGLAVVAPAGTSFAAEYALGDIRIVTPWTRATPPGAKAASGYMTIRNSGSEADRLTKVAADFAQMAEVHEMAMSGEVMTMRMVEGGLEIPAGATVELAPGGMHVMFMMIATPLKPGERYKAILEFAKAGRVEVEFQVEAIGATAPSN